MAEVRAPEKTVRKKGWFKINVALGNDGEPKKIFVGANGHDFLIERGKDVEVPPSVLEVLDHAVKGVDEVDPMNSERTLVVDRKRFPYTVVEAL